MGLKKQEIIPCKEISEEDWLHDEIAEKKKWLRESGLHQLAWAGITFGFVHFIIPEPSLVSESLTAIMSFSQAVYVDP